MALGPCSLVLSVLQGHYVCVLVAHEDVEDDAHWIKRLRHAAEVQ